MTQVNAPDIEKPFLNTRFEERRHFFRLLRKDSVFALRHLLYFGAVVLRKSRNRFRCYLTASHRGNKRAPDWIDVNAVASKVDAITVQKLYLPDFDCLQSLVWNDDANMFPMGDDDPEVYFELNRWGYLLPAALGNAKGNEIGRVLEWIEKHKDKTSAAWEPYSACERVCNLLTYVSVRRDELALPDFEAAAARFVVDTVAWILRHIEYYGEGNTNNHVLNNARALVMAGTVLGDKTICAAGIATFRRFLPLMVGPGGFLRERSSHYQLIVAGWVLDAWRFAQAHYGSTNTDAIFLKETAQRMVEASGLLVDEEGNLLALVGDVSPDLLPRASVLRLLSLHSEFWPIRSRQVEYAAIVDDWFRLSRGEQCVIGNFPSGVFPADFPTHGHSDFTSFVWRSGRVELLADVGRYRYTSDNISAMQTSSVGHNVPLVDGFSPLTESLSATGTWLPTPYASATLSAVVNRNSICLEHDGFARATNVTVHRRTIAITAEGLEIIDDFSGDGMAEIRLRWNFGVDFTMFDSETMTIEGKSGQLELSVKGMISLQTISGSGWRSECYGTIDPSLYVDIIGNVMLPAVISTKFTYKICVE